jgi:hypothetical protein
MTLLASKQHTEGNKRRWQVSYAKWLDNTANIDQIEVTSSSTTCTVADPTILGDEIVFFLVGGVQGETLTVTLDMTDSFENEKIDTISFHVVAP